ncbi:protein of unknown function [Methylorubrum extorquens]|uniref:Uncharacterized protein n=1 Tax=Methylorubrum extorquens TaxID=408 RepID=A0A2N9AH38_METEX|nr:protein of unknown function [Methylorubrum extorquens]
MHGGTPATRSTRSRCAISAQPVEVVGRIERCHTLFDGRMSSLVTYRRLVKSLESFDNVFGGRFYKASGVRVPDEIRNARTPPRRQDG